jgi:hypothetical protein
MNSNQPNRRRFLQAATTVPLLAPVSVGAANSQLAALGGTPVRKERFPSWPVLGKSDRDAWAKVLE